MAKTNVKLRGLRADDGNRIEREWSVSSIKCFVYHVQQHVLPDVECDERDKVCADYYCNQG